MNRNMLRAPLIKSAALLVVVSLLVYLTATSEEGSLWGSIGTLFMAAFRIVQLSLGLVVSLVFCLAVLTGIFLGCVAIISRESASNMLEQIRKSVSDYLLYFRSLLIRDVPPRGTKALHEYGTGLKKEIMTTMNGSVKSLRNDQAAASVYMENLKEHLVRIEINGNDIQILANRLEKQEQITQGIVVASEMIQEQLDQLLESVNKLSEHSHEDSSGQALEDLTVRIDSLDKTSSAMQEELQRLKDLAESTAGQLQTANLSETKDARDRLFSYLKSKEMQEKVEELVTGTLGSNMSYAQVVDHLTENTKGKTARIIKAHPSLVKNYIRFRRNNG